LTMPICTIAARPAQEANTMTPADHLAVAMAALDDARRTLETLTACGDGEVDEAIATARTDVEAHIAALRQLAGECV